MKWLQAETRVQNLFRRQRQRDQDLEAEQDVEACKCWLDISLSSKTCGHSCQILTKITNQLPPHPPRVCRRLTDTAMPRRRRSETMFHRFRHFPVKPMKKLLSVGHHTSSVAKSGVLTIVRVNNCKDTLHRVLLKIILTSSPEKPQHDVKVRCSPLQS